MTTQQTPQKRRITVIPPNPQLTERDIHKKHLRVAPYCRVSTDSEEQLNSYNAQIAYYTEKIAATPEWTMVRLYADEGITGTSMKRRKEFLKMLRDCDRGKIDLIITKSVSRFGRNTLDGLDTVRKLKRKGIGVFFEKENTNTLYMDNEMILTFMMSQAQAESESLSGSVKWGHRKNFKDGKVYYHYASFLGYRKGPDGLPEIDPDEAAIVRRIFARYLLGQSVHQICRDLMSDGVKTAQGSDSWHDSVVRKMLQNEKYIGDALLQKTFMADLFTHEQRKNMGLRNSECLPFNFRAYKLFLQGTLHGTVQRTLGPIFKIRTQISHRLLPFRIHRLGNERREFLTRCRSENTHIP